MRRYAILLGFVLALSSRALAQQTITQPIPKSEIVKKELTLQLAGYGGETDETETAFYAAGAQLMYGLHPRAAINAKFLFISDDSSGDDVEVVQAGLSLAYEMIIGSKGPVQTASVSIFAGIGVVREEIEVPGITPIDDENLYAEAGIQGDFNLTGDWRVTTFAVVTVIFGQEDNEEETILGVGAVLAYRFSDGFEFFGAGVLQFDDISEGWVLYGGVNLALAGPKRP